MAASPERHQPGIGELPASAIALGAGVITLILIYLGSRGLRDFDAALIGYAVGVVFAVIGLTYRYAMWITRPPTWRYFRAGWSNFFSWGRFKRYAILVPKAWWTDIFAQTFIKERSTLRWIMHMSIFWGVVLSCMITIPLSLGWFHLTMAGDAPHDYTMWFFGITLFNFPLNTAFSFIVFHALDFTAALLLVGVLIAFWRRFTDAGLLTTQRFGFDLMPLVMLFGIAITGIALTFSSALWAGHFYWFISLTHEAIVVIWLLYLPFGKFFHIVERPATIGVTLYQQIAHDEDRESGFAGAARCRRCGTVMPSSQFVGDLLATLDDLGQQYDLGGNRGYLQEYCPSCKRVLRGQAYYQLMGQRFL
jgi:hypothetical protein